MPNKLSITTGILRVVLVIVAVVGVAFSIHYNQTLAQLREDHANLQAQVGVLKISDPSKVAISYVPHSDDAVPPGVTKAHIWRYRIHVPANYGLCHVLKRRLITADSPRAKGGSSSTWNSPKPEAEQMVATLALFKSEGRWLFSRTTGGSSSTSNLPNDLQLDSLDDFVVETAVSADDPSRVFDPDEAICLFRLREKEVAKKRNGKDEKGFYRGVSLYMHSEKRKDAFTAWASGKAESMDEAE